MMSRRYVHVHMSHLHLYTVQAWTRVQADLPHAHVGRPSYVAWYIKVFEISFHPSLALIRKT